MSSVTYYDQATGVIRGHITGNQYELDHNVPQGCATIEGIYDAALFVIVDGAAKPAPPPPPAPPPTKDELLTYASEKQNAVLAQVWTFDVGTADTPIKLTTRLDDRGQSSMLQLLVWSSFAGPSDVEPYSNVDSSSTTVTPAEARALALAAGAVKSASYVTYNQVAAAIAATPPTVTTTADVDAAAWPKPS